MGGCYDDGIIEVKDNTKTSSTAELSDCLCYDREEKGPSTVQRAWPKIGRIAHQI